MKKTYKITLVALGNNNSVSVVVDSDEADPFYDMANRITELAHIKIGTKIYNPRNVISIEFKRTWKTKFIETFLEKK